jgi:hypothetical protein
MFQPGVPDFGRRQHTCVYNTDLSPVADEPIYTEPVKAWQLAGRTAPGRADGQWGRLVAASEPTPAKRHRRETVGHAPPTSLRASSDSAPQP